MIVTTEELTKRINEILEEQEDLHYLIPCDPQYQYTPEEIQKGNYVLINPDDQNWQLGFEPDEEIPDEAYEYQLDEFLDYSDMPLMNIFIY